MLSSYKFLNIKIPLSIKMSNMSHKKESNMLLSSLILSIIYLMHVQNMLIYLSIFLSVLKQMYIGYKFVTLKLNLDSFTRRSSNFSVRGI